MVERYSELNPEVISLESVSYRYPNSTSDLLKDINLTLPQGKIVILAGANGSGKSSLAKIIAGLVSPTTGTVTFPSSESGRAMVGLVLQNPTEQLISQDVESELAFGLENHAIAPAEMAQRITAIAEQFGLTERLSTPIEQLSDGLKQLVAIASAVILQPQFLILDEPTAYLDPYWTVRIRKTIVSFLPQCGIVWITGSIPEVLLADTIYCLESDGTIGYAGGIDSTERWQLECYGFQPMKTV